jgi:RNA polymerase sigma-70 factor (ECF subfamily)
MAGFEEADELTQDVFVRAWQKLGTFRGEAQFGTWLHRVAVNVMLEHRKVRNRRQERFPAAGVAEENMPGEAWPAGAAVDLEAAIDRLPDGARRVFVLHDVEGFRHEEIAEMLGVTAGTSKSQLHRARMLLRAHLSA